MQEDMQKEDNNMQEDDDMQEDMQKEDNYMQEDDDMQEEDNYLKDTFKNGY